MLIEKGALKKETCKDKQRYYENARGAMFDLLQAMYNEGLINKVLLPGYIGWSPREGSGIFDPINSIMGLSRQYYKMKENLNIDKEDLFEKASDSKTVVLVVNYFGFRDENISEIICRLKERGVWIIEDNAHGMYTYFKYGRIGADATFFSLHKMLPFENGGALLLFSDELKRLALSKENHDYSDMYDYDFGEIARKRTDNYLILDQMIRDEKYNDVFTPLKEETAIRAAVPQTYPVLIRKGNRDKIYELMNNDGFGVVSLYHTLIPELQENEFEKSKKVSKCILNLPVHQDVDPGYYNMLLEKLVAACEITDAK